MGQSTTLLNIHSQLPTTGSFSIAELDPGTQQHLKVLRIRSEEVVRFLDGRGLIVNTRCTQNDPLMFVVENVRQHPPLFPQLELCLAAPKGDALWEAVTQATEVGATSIRLLRTDHSQYSKAQEAPVVRAQKISDAACEQCVRPWRVQIQPGWHTLASTLQSSDLKIFADEILAEKEIYGFARGQVPTLNQGRLILFIGPEGGWSSEERQLLDTHAQPLGLGPLILKVPTASAVGLHYLKSLYSVPGSR